MNQKSRTKTLAVKKNNNLLWMLFSAIAVLTCFILLQRSVFAQEASNSAKKFNITFPISTLGNCASLEECKAYCEDPNNKEACVNFAKSKGFYKAPQGAGNARSRLIFEKAKEEFGCESEEECRAFCKEEENKEKCKEFAKKYKLGDEKKKAITNAILEKAKEALGCADGESCKGLCQKEENREKCSSFAKSTGLSGGMVKVASGSAGFGNVKQIMEKCAKDPEFCKENAGQLEMQILKQSDEFCKNNSEKCKDFIRYMKEASRSGKFTPNSEQAWEHANERAKFCREYPEKCKNSNQLEEPNKKRLEYMREFEKKQKELKREKEEKEFELEDDDLKPEVQGIQKTPSFFDWFLNVFLK